MTQKTNISIDSYNLCDQKFNNIVKVIVDEYFT